MRSWGEPAGLAATALSNEDLAVDLLEPLCNGTPAVVTSDEIQGIAATPVPFRAVRDGFDDRPGERPSIIYISQPTVSLLALLHNEAEWPSAACRDDRHAGRHRLQEHLPKGFIVGGGHEDVGQVQGAGQFVVRQPAAEEHVAKSEAAGGGVGMLAFPFTGYATANEQVVGRFRLPHFAVETVHSRHRLHQKRQPLEVQEPTSE